VGDRDLGKACQRLRDAVPEVVARFEAYRLDLILKPISVLRTVEEQQALYAQGRTAPGRIVTNADGVRNLSRHQCQERHGELAAHAVDLGIFRPGGSYVSAVSEYVDLPRIADELGLKSGASWGDYPHLECRV
jgi:peptidoglycan L-alanyl-D-glutamate endopeptidase CwlK